MTRCTLQHAARRQNTVQASRGRIRVPSKAPQWITSQKRNPSMLLFGICNTPEGAKLDRIQLSQSERYAATRQFLQSLATRKIQASIQVSKPQSLLRDSIIQKVTCRPACGQALYKATHGQAAPTGGGRPPRNYGNKAIHARPTKVRPMPRQWDQCSTHAGP